MAENRDEKVSVPPLTVWRHVPKWYKEGKEEARNFCFEDNCKIIADGNREM